MNSTPRESRTPARLLGAVAAGLCVACAAQGDGVQLASHDDYEVYAAVLREQFIDPPREDHADGGGWRCRDEPWPGEIRIVRETRLRRRGGASRDSALAAELPPQAASLVPALRATDTLPPRTLRPDSFSLRVPVRVMEPSPASAETRDGPLPITLSRVVYSADGTWALVHAVQPCRAEYDADYQEEVGGSAPGRAVLVALQRRTGAWVVARSVALYVE